MPTSSKDYLFISNGYRKITAFLVLCVYFDLLIFFNNLAHPLKYILLGNAIMLVVASLATNFAEKIFRSHSPNMPWLDNQKELKNYDFNPS